MSCPTFWKYGGLARLVDEETGDDEEQIHQQFYKITTYLPIYFRKLRTYGVCIGDADCVHLMSADVRIPSGHGGWEVCSYMRLALGRWYLDLVCVVRQGFWWGWCAAVRNACNIGPKRAQGSMVKGMSTRFFLDRVRRWPHHHGWKVYWVWRACA